MSQTPNLGLNKPAEGDLNWASAINQNWDTLDNAVVVYPTEATLWPENRKTLSGTASSTVYISSQCYTNFCQQSPAANGNSCSNEFLLGAGSYKMNILYAKYVTRGIIDWYIKESGSESWTAILTGDDHYAATYAYNQKRTVDVTITSSGLHTLKSVINGKNASATDYHLTWTKIDFRQA